MSDKRNTADKPQSLPPDEAEQGDAVRHAAAHDMMAHDDAPRDDVSGDDVPGDDAAPLAGDMQALRLSKAMEQAASRDSLFPLPQKPAEDASAGDALAPSPTSSDALRGDGKINTALINRPKRRRSTSMTMLKVMLPLIALVTLGYLFYWWYIHNREAVINVATPDKPSAATPMVTVNNFKYSSTDSQHRPYTITADSASQPQDKTIDTISLVRPQANFTLAGNHWMTITAQNGLYHRDADLIDLDGDVTMFHDNGMQFHTSHAQIDMKAKIAAGTQPVQGQNATSDISSEGFKILDNGDTVIFTGKSQLKLHSKGKDGSQ